MRPTQTFESAAYHERFGLTARATESGFGGPIVDLVVEDKESGAVIRLRRNELMPLLRAIKEALKAVEDAVAGLPSDPVERASRRVPHHGLASSLQRAYLLKAYREEMAGLQKRFVERFDKATAQSNAPRPPPEK